MLIHDEAAASGIMVQSESGTAFPWLAKMIGASQRVHYARPVYTMCAGIPSALVRAIIRAPRAFRAERSHVYANSTSAESSRGAERETLALFKALLEYIKSLRSAIVAV